jgi:hypothetical protein
MGLLEDQLLDDAVNVFVDDDGFGEIVTYTPSQASQSKGATPRTIKAVIVRDPPIPDNADASFIMPKMICTVANDPVAGIASSQVDYGGDTVTVAYRIGTTAKAYQIRQTKLYENNDAGCVTVELN